MPNAPEKREATQIQIQQQVQLTVAEPVLPRYCWKSLTEPSSRAPPAWAVEVAALQRAQLPPGPQAPPVQLAPLLWE